MREHTKPIFHASKLLTIHNLYFYHTTTQIFSILKYRTPISLYNILQPSHRKETLLITPHRDLKYVYDVSTIWNTARRILGLEYSDFSINHSFVKSTIKTHLLMSQNIGTEHEWTPKNFELNFIPESTN